MEISEHIPILKRIGGVLVIIGLIDIGVMIYCITNRISYSSSLVLAVIAGVPLMRGNLRVASYVRWFSTFFLSAIVSMLFAWPFIQPFNLTFTQIRLNPGYAFISLAYVAFVLCFLFWVSIQLGSQPILNAISNAGIKISDKRTAVGGGIGLVALLTIFASLMSGSERAERAKKMAEQQVGPGYSYYVSSLRISSGGQKSSVSAVVTAWNDKEIKNISVHWDDH
jgi:hypothetical protein